MTNTIPGPVAWINGEWIPFNEAAIPITDLAMWGIAATEMLRTFSGRPFQVTQHLERLNRSANAIGFELPENAQSLEAAIENLCERNFALLSPDSDLGISVFASAGHNPSFFSRTNRTQAGRPTICLTTFELPFDTWNVAAMDGVHLVVSKVRQVPDDSVPPEVKSRSRLHWYLAGNDVRQRHLHAHALLLDKRGRATETSTSNVFALIEGVLVSPRRGVLPGISRDLIVELAADLELPHEFRDLTPPDITSAAECFLSSSLSCLLPVTRFNDQPIADGQAGPMFHRLAEAWSQSVGVDIIGQILTVGERMHSNA